METGWGALAPRIPGNRLFFDEIQTFIVTSRATAAWAGLECHALLTARVLVCHIAIEQT